MNRLDKMEDEIKKLWQYTKENAIKSANAYKKNQQRIEKLEREAGQINSKEVKNEDHFISELTERVEKLEQAIFKKPAA